LFKLDCVAEADALLGESVVVDAGADVDEGLTAVLATEMEEALRLCT
jgi:hypothetical protein